MAVANSQAPVGWMLPFKNELTWSKDGKDLYFGFKPMDAKAAAEAAAKGAGAPVGPTSDGFDIDG